MSSLSERILVLGGMALALWGMSYGLWYAVFAEHQALNGIGRTLSSAFVSASERHTSEARAALDQYREAKYVYDRQVDVHGHWIGLAMILIVVGLGLDRVSLPNRVKLVLSLLALLGAVFFPMGVLLQTVDHGSTPRLIAVLGSALLIFALVGFASGFARMHLARGARAGTMP
jgi:hypothetical protein